MISITLPWPPSVNHYWVRTKFGGMTIGRHGKAFRAESLRLIHGYKIPSLGNARCDITIDVYPPDKRKRDLDNILKGILDVFSHAKVIDDDSQFDIITIRRFEVSKPAGRIEVTIDKINEQLERRR